MGIPYQVYANGRRYTVVDDVQFDYWALIAGAVRDELQAAEPFPAGFTVQLSRPQIDLKVMDSGLFCLSGYPDRVFPDLANSAYDIDLVIQAPGYRERALSVHVAQAATLPVQVPTVLLVRNPVRLQGRVVTAGGNPIAGARVMAVDDPNPVQPLSSYIAILRSPLVGTHLPGVPVRRRTFTPAGAAKRLATPTPAGSLEVHLNSRSGLATGDVLRIGEPSWGAFRRIHNMPQPSNLNRPGRVVLHRPLETSFPAGAPVQPVSVGQTILETALSQEAEAGSAVLLLLDPLPGEIVQIGDPPSEEYQALGALTGADGFYQLDGITHVHTLFLEAHAGGFAAMLEPLAWTVDYERTPNLVDFRLS